MALSGKLIAYVEISKKGDVFHLLRHNPNELAAISPDNVHGCDLRDGVSGAVGSVISWHYTDDGNRKNTKEIIEEVNEENHTIVFKVIEGDLLGELYKTCTITFHVEPKDGNRKNTKEIIEEVNEENHTIVFKVIEGDLLGELYKTCTITFHVEPKGNGQVVVTWTIEFEKLDTSVPYPTVFMDCLCRVIKDVDAHDSTT